MIMGLAGLAYANGPGNEPFNAWGSAETRSSTLLPACLLEFPSSECPTATDAVCGAFFDGGDGCVSAGLIDCYATGTHAYRVPIGGTLEITFEDGVNEVEFHFAHEGVTAEGEITFYDENDNVVGQLETGGDCLLARPDKVSNEEDFFPYAVRATVTASGGSVWIDEFWINPSNVPDPIFLDRFESDPEND